MERSVGNSEPAVSEISPPSGDHVELSTMGSVPEKEIYREVVTTEDRLKVTEFVRVISSSESENVGIASGVEMLDSRLSARGLVNGDPSGYLAPPGVLRNRFSAGSMLFCDGGIQNLTSATDLMNLSMNTSQDLTNLKRRLRDLRNVCDRLYNKLGGSFRFLRVSFCQRRHTSG